MKIEPLREGFEIVVGPATGARYLCHRQTRLARVALREALEAWRELLLRRYEPLQYDRVARQRLAQRHFDCWQMYALGEKPLY